VSKRGSGHIHFLTQAYKNLFPDTTNASIPAVTTLRSCVKYVRIFVHNKIGFLLPVLLTVHWRLLSE
jgi:hypothetical protein